LKSSANAKLTERDIGLHTSSPEAEVNTYSTEIDGSPDFSKHLLGPLEAVLHIGSQRCTALLASGTASRRAGRQH
jgi:hypothetical protein